jgi:hypothetical protein
LPKILTNYGAYTEKIAPLKIHGAVPTFELPLRTTLKTPPFPLQTFPLGIKRNVSRNSPKKKKTNDDVKVVVCTVEPQAIGKTTALTNPPPIAPIIAHASPPVTSPHELGPPKLTKNALILPNLTNNPPYPTSGLFPNMKWITPTQTLTMIT